MWIGASCKHDCERVCAIQDRFCRIFYGEGFQTERGRGGGVFQKKLKNIHPCSAHLKLAAVLLTPGFLLTTSYSAKPRPPHFPLLGQIVTVSCYWYCSRRCNLCLQRPQQRGTKLGLIQVASDFVHQEHTAVVKTYAFTLVVKMQS